MNKDQGVGTKLSKGVQLIHKLLIELKVIFSTEVHFGVYCHHYKPLPFERGFSTPHNEHCT